MTRKHRKKKQRSPSAAGDSVVGTPPPPSGGDFYSSPVKEQPLYVDRHEADRRVRKTTRHKQVGGRREQRIDPREKVALMAILRSVIVIVLLLMAFVVLLKGISLYEESIVQKQELAVESVAVRPALEEEAALVANFDINNEALRKKFAERLERWKEVDRRIRVAGELYRRDINDEAIKECLTALKEDPVHAGGLELLGNIYAEEKKYDLAANAFARLMSLDPSRKETQRKLLETLDALGDYRAVEYIAEWYLRQNVYDADIERMLANAQYAAGNYEQAAESYSRVLADQPDNDDALERIAASYMKLERYEDALVPLEKLCDVNYHDPVGFKRLAGCQAQLKNGAETARVLGDAIQLFGAKMVLGWIQDPVFDPVRKEHVFQSFVDHSGGEDLRKWLEKLAEDTKKREEKKESGFGLKLPEAKDSGLLKLRPNK